MLHNESPTNMTMVCDGVCHCSLLQQYRLCPRGAWTNRYRRSSCLVEFLPMMEQMWLSCDLVMSTDCSLSLGMSALSLWCCCNLNNILNWNVFGNYQVVLMWLWCERSVAEACAEACLHQCVQRLAHGEDGVSGVGGV